MDKLEERHLLIVQNTSVSLIEEAVLHATLTLEMMASFAEWTQEYLWKWDSFIKEWVNTYNGEWMTTAELIQEYLKTL